MINQEMQERLEHSVPFYEYADERKSMNSSALRKILKSPRHFLSYMLDQQEDEEEREKEHFRFGRAAHLMMLEPARFRELYVVMPVFTGLTKEGKESTQSKEARDKKSLWLNNQKPDAVILTEKEMVDLTGMVESVMSHSIAANLLQDGSPEVSGWFTDDETKVNCRFRADYISKDREGQVHLIDLKTAREGSAGLFSHEIHRLKYHLQMAFYYDGLTKIMKKEPQTATFIVVEKTPPYEVYVYACDDNMIDMGREWYRQALRIYKRCVETNQWPGAQNQAQMISLPKFAQMDTFPEFDFK